jgi:hypothetical protein
MQSVIDRWEFNFDNPKKYTKAQLVEFIGRIFINTGENTYGNVIIPNINIKSFNDQLMSELDSLGHTNYKLDINNSIWKPLVLR